MISNDNISSDKDVLNDNNNSNNDILINSSNKSSSSSFKRLSKNEIEFLRNNGKNLPTKKIIFVGDSGVGKTSTINQFKDNSFNFQTPSTIGFGFTSFTYELEDGSYFNFQIWDTAGQELYRTLTPQYFKDISGCVIMYDITDKDTFEDGVEFYLNKLKEEYGDNIPCCILVGNKLDLEEKRQVSQERAVEYAQKYKIIFTEASAKMNKNVTKVFKDLFEMINFQHKKMEKINKVLSECNMHFSDSLKLSKKKSQEVVKIDESNCYC